MIAAVNYIVDKASDDLNDADTAIDYILDVIDSKQDQLKENFNFKEVRYGKKR